MKKIFISVCIASSLFAQNINVQNGWQLLGAVEDINVSKFDSTCVDYLWKYDNGNWQVYIANEQTYDLSNIQSITALNQGDGFWVKGNSLSGCDINTTTSQSDNSTLGFTSDMIVGKTFYAIYDDGNYDYENSTYTFNNDGSLDFVSGDESGSVSYNIVNGIIMITNGHEGNFTINSIAEDYYAYTDQGIDSDDGSVDINENARMYFEESTATAYFNSLPTNPYLPLAVYVKKDSTNLYIKMEFSNLQTIINAMEIDENGGLLGPTLNLDSSQEFRFYKNNNDQIASILFNNTSSVQGNITTTQGNNYFEAQIPLSMLTGSDIGKITGNINTDYADDYYFYSGNSNASASTQLSKSFDITSEYTPLSFE